MTFNRHVFETLSTRRRHRVAPGKGCHPDMGYLRTDDPIYPTGPIVSGIPIFTGPPKKWFSEDNGSIDGDRSHRVPFLPCLPCGAI